MISSIFKVIAFLQKFLHEIFKAMEPCFDHMLQRRQTEIRRILLSIIYLHFFLNGEKLYAVSKG